MPTGKPRDRAKQSAGKRITPPARATTAHEARAEIKMGMRHLEKSLAEIRRGLRTTERQIAADAHRHIRELRKQGRGQLSALRSRQHEAVRTLKQLSETADASWSDIKRSADAMLADARTTAASVVERFRNALTA